MAIATEPYVPSAAELKQQFLEDLQLQAMDAGVDEPPIQAGTEWDLLGTGLANIGSVLLANQQLYDADADPNRAEGDALDEWRSRLQLPLVSAAPASGTVTITTIGTATIDAGQRFQAPNGFVGEVLADHIGVSGDVTVDAQMTTNGSGGNILAGTIVRLTGGPPNLQVEAVIPEDWTGGAEDEDDARKRERIQNRIKNAGSNWGDLRDKALEATNAISGAYVYQAIGGPGSVKVAVTSSTSTSTREVGAGTVSDVQDYVDAAFPDGTWLVEVQSVVDEPAEVALKLTLPTTGRHRWLAGGPRGLALSTSVTSAVDFTLTYLLSGSISNLAVGETIACWSPTDQTAATARVTSISGDHITTTTWSNGSGPTGSGFWIFPACDDLAGIVDAWKDIMMTLGPGENVYSWDPRYQFAARKPLISGTDPSALTNLQLMQLQTSVPEATSITYLNLPTLGVPGLASDPPPILALFRFAIYPT